MRGPDVNYTLPIEFLEAVNGAKKRVDMPDGKSLDISIPAGVQDGQTMRLKGQGGAGIGGGPSGDALIKVTVRPHPCLPPRRQRHQVGPSDHARRGAGRRTGSGRHYHRPVSLKSRNTRIPAAFLRLRGKGVKGHPKGDHLVELQVVMPPHPDAALARLHRRMGAEAPL